MISIRTLGQISLATAALLLTACMADVDDTTGSRLAQPAATAGTPPRKPIDTNDIAIVGQEVSDAITSLPVVSGAPTPPVVQFTGVTSIVTGPGVVDTDPYTELLRDRLLLLTRQKLRFVERTLPQLVTKKKKSKKASPEAGASEEAAYQILAELRGKYKDDLYKIQVQFVDVRTGEVLYDELFRIRKEAGGPSQDAPPEVVVPPPETDSPAAATGGLQ